MVSTTVRFSHRRRQGPAARGASLALLAILILSASACGQSSDSTGASKVQGASAPQPIVLPETSAASDWNKLTPSQHKALQPLEGEWRTLSDGQRRKWISLSANYPQMTPAQQATLHERMVQWANLSARQRAVARLNFAETRALDPKTKAEQWQAYQALSDEEKHRLAKSAPPKPPRTALATKPTPPDQINHQLRLHAKTKTPALPASAATTAPGPGSTAARPVVTDITDEPGKP